MTLSSTDHDVALRAVRIIRGAGYLSLATATPETGPWAAQLQYAAFADPLRFVVGSHVEARHSRDIGATGVAAASLSTFPGSAHGLDGLQICGPCRALTATEVESVAPLFYEQMFPEEADPLRHALPLAQLHGDGAHRLLELRVRELWILDLERWEREGRSTRRAVDLGSVEAALGRD